MFESGDYARAPSFDGYDDSDTAPLLPIERSVTTPVDGPVDDAPLRPRTLHPSTSVPVLRPTANLDAESIPALPSRRPLSLLDFDRVEPGSKNWMHEAQYAPGRQGHVVKALLDACMDGRPKRVPSAAIGSIRYVVPAVLEDDAIGVVSAYFRPTSSGRLELLRVVFLDKEEVESADATPLEIETPAGALASLRPMAATTVQATAEVELSTKAERMRAAILKQLPQEVRADAQRDIDLRLRDTQSVLLTLTSQLLPEDYPRPTNYDELNRLIASGSARRVLTMLLPDEPPQAGEPLEDDELRAATDAAHIVILSHLQNALKDESKKNWRSFIEHWGRADTVRVENMLTNAAYKDKPAKTGRIGTIVRGFELVRRERGKVTPGQGAKIVFKGLLGSFQKYEAPQAEEHNREARRQLQEMRSRPQAAATAGESSGTASAPKKPERDIYAHMAVSSDEESGTGEAQDGGIESGGEGRAGTDSSGASSVDLLQDPRRRKRSGVIFDGASLAAARSALGTRAGMQQAGSSTPADDDTDD